MPTYEYQCENCGYRFEKFQPMSDGPIRECPRCSGTVKRLIGGGLAVIVKGSGFEKSDTAEKTCCGRSERCSKPPCSEDGFCKR